MKRIGALLLALLLCLCRTALADGSENIEVIRMDGVSVIVLTPEEVVYSARLMAMNAATTVDKSTADFVLPQALTIIYEEAFAGTAARSVEVTENVVSIERRAFADCKNMREITIPATVVSIDDHALDGCENVTVYGTNGTEAERFAAVAGFTFIDASAEPTPPENPKTKEKPSPLLPFVSAD